MKHEKKFLIIGSQNAITYKEFFPLLKENKVWLGFCSRAMSFEVPCSYDGAVKNKEDGKCYKKLGNVCWYTNLDHAHRHHPMILYKSYDPKKYPTYDNYDAIEVSKTKLIPKDYVGVMGVPISFLDKYCPDQFEIIGLDRYTVPQEYLVGGRVAIDGTPCYARILVRNLNPKNIKDKNSKKEN